MIGVAKDAPEPGETWPRSKALAQIHSDLEPFQIVKLVPYDREVMVLTKDGEIYAMLSIVGAE